MANKEKFLRGELRKWLEEGLLGQDVYETLLARYKDTAWDVSVIIRWTLALGAIMLGIGLISFFMLIIESLALVAVVLTLLCGLAYYFGFALLRPNGGNYYPKSGNALIAVACLLLCGDIFVIGDLFSSGSGHWPVLLLITAVIYLLLAYLHKNTLVLLFALIALATWFGTETGYISGWGAYYLGLNYPMRFALVSPFVILVGYLHQALRVNVPVGFIKSYYAIGLLYVNLALWILSIFGNYGDMSHWYGASQFELFGYVILWGLADVIIFLIGSRYRNSMFTGFALVFLILNLYTRYFEYFWEKMDQSLFFILLGAGSMAVGLFFERRLRQKRLR